MKTKRIIPALLAAFALSACCNSGETSIYNDATLRGDAASQKTIGDMFRIGQGAPQDDQKAMEWYAKACDDGLQEGCDNYKKLEGK